MSFRSLVGEHRNVRWLSLMKNQQYGTESMMVMSFKQISTDARAATKYTGLIGAPEVLFDGGNLDPRLFLNLYDGFRRLLRGPSASCHHDTIFIVAVLLRILSTVCSKCCVLLSPVTIPSFV